MVDLEKTMYTREVAIPVYFLVWDKTLQSIISNVDVLSAAIDGQSSKKETAAEGTQIFSTACHFNDIFHISLFFSTIQLGIRCRISSFR